MLIKDATKLYLGSTPVTAAYAGAKKVWPIAAPLQVPGLSAWIDASQDVGVFTEGQTVGYDAMPDHSPSDRTYLTTGGYGPQWRSNMGGRPTYEWVHAGVAYGLDAGTWNAGPAGLTFLFVGKVTGGSYPMFVVHGPDPDGFEMRHDGSTLQIVLRYSAAGIVYSHGGATQDGPDHLFALRVRGPAGSDAYIDAAKVTGGGPAMPNISQALYIGRRQGGYPFVGLMREVLVYAGPVSDADMTKLWTYLKAKWGL